jgi:hypothetical protein
MTVREIDILFMKDSRPLEWGSCSALTPELLSELSFREIWEAEGTCDLTMQNLTSPTVAKLGIERLLPAELVLHSPAMTASFI